ncbi:hypothetical protein OG302_20420 [Streptomyces sp. NBC_01283]|uniref:hypothetical protein n=1 Tax=Streptomyces sp. NBC_01283 TaxID=2903812 RepID=UPI00352FDFB9|nr:hypothetical protein OG302_20420 [Streptomyces sp. NBC_01283]
MSSRMYSGMTEDEAKHAAYTEQMTGSPDHHGQGMTDQGGHYTCQSSDCDAAVIVDPPFVPGGVKRF